MYNEYYALTKDGADIADEFYQLAMTTMRNYPPEKASEILSIICDSASNASAVRRLSAGVHKRKEERDAKTNVGM